MKEYGDEMARYSKEKNQIKTDAENIVKEQELLKQHNGAFALAVMVFQIAIMCSAVGALIKKKILWLAGLALGAVGFVYMFNGFFLWF